MSKELTKLTFITLFALHNDLGGPPTIRQLVEQMGLSPASHTSSVHGALQKLKEMGLVGVTQARGIYKPVVGFEAAMEALDGGETLEETREEVREVLRDGADSPKGG